MLSKLSSVVNAGADDRRVVVTLVAAAASVVTTYAVARSLHRSYRQRCLANELNEVAIRKRKDRDERLYGRETQVLDAAAIRLGLKRGSNILSLEHIHLISSHLIVSNDC